jgi:hypothetical protein
LHRFGHFHKLYHDARTLNINFTLRGLKCGDVKKDGKDQSGRMCEKLRITLSQGGGEYRTYNTQEEG